MDDDEYPIGEAAAMDRYAPPWMDTPDPRGDDNVAPLWALRRPRGSGLLPDDDVNSLPVMGSTFQPGAGTEDFDRMYKLASGGGGGGDDNKMKMLMMLGGG
jgi:hypothetical protein